MSQSRRVECLASETFIPKRIASRPETSAAIFPLRSMRPPKFQISDPKFEVSDSKLQIPNLKLQIRISSVRPSRPGPHIAPGLEASNGRDLVAWRRHNPFRRHGIRHARTGKRLFQTTPAVCTTRHVGEHAAQRTRVRRDTKLELLPSPIDPGVAFWSPVTVEIRFERRPGLQEPGNQATTEHPHNGHIVKTARP